MHPQMGMAGPGAGTGTFTTFCERSCKLTFENIFGVSQVQIFNKF